MDFFRGRWFVPGLLGVCLVLLFAGVALGSTTLPVSQWISCSNVSAGGKSCELHPVISLRLIRICAAFLIGSALTLSGATFQAVLRNPLAEPFTLGISGGAAVGAALSFVTNLRNLHSLMTVLCAFAGALLTLGFVLFLSRGGKRGKESLLLSGVITGTVCGSVLMYILSIVQIDELSSITWWLLGDLQGVDPVLLLPAGILLAVIFLILRICAMGLNMLSIGDSQTWNAGFDPARLTLLCVICASLLAGMTIAMAGIISFCGLIVPHMVRRLAGCDYRKTLFPLLLTGGAFLMFCDILSRLIHPEKEIPIGVITSLIGGPLFLWIINRKKERVS